MIKVLLNSILLLSLFSLFQPATMFVFGQDVETTPLFECWKLETGSINRIASDNNKQVFFSSSNGKIESINIENGDVLWKSQIGGEIISDILYEDGELYVVSEVTNQNSAEKTIKIQSINALSGISIWQQSAKWSNLTEKQGSATLINLDTKIYLFSTTGELLILGKSDGLIESQTNFGKILSTEPIYSDNKFYLGTEQKEFTLLSSDGKLLASNYQFSESPRILSKGNNDDILVGDLLGNVLSINLSSKKILWRFRAGAEITGIKTYAKTVLVSSNDNFVYLISSETGNIIWKNKLAGRSQSVVFTNKEKGLLLTTTLNSEIFTVINLKDGRMVNQIFLSNDQFFVGSPFLSAGYIILPTNAGFSAYRLDPCKQE